MNSLENLKKEYRQLNTFKNCKTLDDFIKVTIDDYLSNLKYELYELVDDICSNKYSNEEIANRLENIVLQLY